jgi:DNA-binding PadR family transcriptional regulator
MSAVYITLTRLEGKGLVSSWKGKPTEVRGGKARRNFKLEPEGFAALREARGRLLSMWRGLEEAFEGDGDPGRE